MTNIDNPNKFSTMSNANGLADIKDDDDFPHVGIIKALSVGLGQNFAFGGYNATSISATSITFAGGKVMRDGEILPVNGDTLTIAAVSNGTGDSYYLAVVPTGATPTITLRTPSKKGVTPDITAGDIIVAVIAHTETNPMNVQFLTVKKAENSLSVARDASGTYTEMGTIACDTNSIDITTTNSNADINLTPHGTGDIKLGTLAIDGDQTVGSGQNGYVLTYTHSNGKAALAAASGGGDVVDDTSPQLGGDLDVNGNKITGTIVLDGNTAVDAGHTLTIDSDLELSVSSNDVVIKNTNQDNDMIFKVNDGGADTEVMRIDGDVAKVGIGTATPAEKLSVSGNIRSSGDIIIGGALDHNGTTVGFYATTPVARPNVGNGSFAPNPAAFGRPAPDPSANPGFEPNVDNYMSILEQEIMTISTKLNDLIDALQLQGLIL